MSRNNDAYPRYCRAGTSVRGFSEQMTACAVNSVHPQYVISRNARVTYNPSVCARTGSSAVDRGSSRSARRAARDGAARCESRVRHCGGDDRAPAAA
jgi:hypothetical protein